MPRAEIAPKQAIFTLSQLHGELAGKFMDNKRAAIKIRMAMMQVEAVLQMLQPGFSATFFLPGLPCGIGTLGGSVGGNLAAGLMLRFRIPELFLGCFLTVAVFATGMLFVNRPNPQQAGQTVKQQEASGHSTKPETPDSELTGSTWLTKDAAGFFTFVLVAVGVGQAVLFFIQLSYMRKGMDDATIVANAGRESTPQKFKPKSRGML